MYVTLDPPRKRASYVHLWTPRTPYQACQGRVARRRKRKLDRPRVVQKAHQIYHLPGRARADLPKLRETVVALVPKVGSVGKHRSAVAAKPFCARYAVVSAHQESLAVFPRKFPFVQHHFASGGTGGWVGGAGSEFPPSSVISRGEKAAGPFPAARTVQRDQSSACRTPPR